MRYPKSYQTARIWKCVNADISDNAADKAEEYEKTMQKPKQKPRRLKGRRVGLMRASRGYQDNNADRGKGYPPGPPTDLKMQHHYLLAHFRFHLSGTVR
jgi:hypothetical protein